jgi:glycosyltransferase involved in cell wall biosynthesis
MKRALIFDPYLDTLGGGERYALTLALGLVKEGYEVQIAWSEKKELKSAEKRFGLDLSTISINSEAYNLCRQKTSIFQRFLFTSRYDLIFWVSDGSLPLLFGKNNLIHFQVPFKNIGGSPFINKIKTIFVHRFVYNSDFTKDVHESHFPKEKSFVLYPPIDTESFTPGKKENIILSVARFDSPSHGKRQDILIDSFRKLTEKVKNYKLILVGGLIGSDEIISKLKDQSKGLPVEFVINPEFNLLKNLYSKSKFFWHAAGFDINEKEDPEKVEHFGMTTVEAMASGDIPVVIAKGGQKEIIIPSVGYLCTDETEIAEKTINLISDPDKSLRFSEAAISRSRDFSITKFYEKLKTLL